MDTLLDQGYAPQEAKKMARAEVDEAISTLNALDEAAMQIPEAERIGSKMNGKMERCK